MVVVDGQGVPLGKKLYSASPHEARLREVTVSFHPGNTPA